MTMNPTPAADATTGLNVMNHAPTADDTVLNKFINIKINFLKHSNKMKKYIKPEMKSQLIELENCILAGSIDVPISEDPATGPALSKGLNLFGDDDEPTGTNRSSSVWDE